MFRLCEDARQDQETSEQDTREQVKKEYFSVITAILCAWYGSVQDMGPKQLFYNRNEWRENEGEANSEKKIQLGAIVWFDDTSRSSNGQFVLDWMEEVLQGRQNPYSVTIKLSNIP